MLALPISQAFAQDINFAGPANQKKIDVIISDDGSVSVQHVVAKTGVPVQLNFIEGSVSDIRVSGPEGGDKQFASIGGGGVMLFPSSDEQVVEYVLSDAIEDQDGLWTWDFRYLETTIFHIPESIEMIFIDNRPILLDDIRAFRCHGCEMSLQFFETDNPQIEEVIWEEYRFTVPITSTTKVESFYFNQPSRTISFDVTKEGKFVTMILPLELLWEPYEVYLNDEKIIFHPHNKNGTHVWLSIKPHQVGTVSIIGTTAIPEFSMFLPLILGISLVALFQYRYRIIPR